MKRLRAWVFRLAGSFAKERCERELAQEIDSHLQMHIDDNMRSGMTYEKARREAVLQLGGVEYTKETYRERSTFPLLESISRNTRFAIRQLRRSPGFTCTAILMLALGLCASISLFAFVDAALIRPLPYANPNRLVDVTERNATIPRADLSYFDYLDWKKLNEVFSSLDVFNSAGYLLETSTGSKPIPGVHVSDGFFRTVGVSLILGRDFRPSEELTGAPHVAILSYAAWQQLFGGTRSVLGQTIRLSGIPHVVVGVLPRSFEFALKGNAAVWTPLNPSGPCESRRSCHNLEGIARLKAGVSVQAALANMQTIASQLEQRYPDSNRGQWASVLPLSEVIVGSIRPILFALLGGGLLLLLISSINVASLLLVRSEGRRREVAIRSSLGASTSRLFIQFGTEAAVLVGIAAATGLILAVWVMKAFVNLIPENMLAGMPYLHGLGLNTHLLWFAGVIVVAAICIFSLIPGLHLKFSKTGVELAEGSRGSAGRGWRRMGSNLVVVELAIAMVLLVGAGLLTKSLHRLLHVDLGFQSDHLAMLSVFAPPVRYEKDEQQVVLGEKTTENLTQVPGVQYAGLTSVLPVSFNGNTDWIRFVGRPYNGEHNEVNERAVSIDYFKTIQAPLIRGRYFTSMDDATHPKVVIINEALAKKYFPNEDPLGKRFGDTNLTAKSIRVIVGIVDNIREGPLDSAIWPAEYVPFRQSPDYSFSVVVRTGQDERSILPALSAAINRIDPELGTLDQTSMNDRIYDSPSAYLHRSAAWLVGGFAGLALLLGVIGLYGVVAYSVSQRTREIGIRMALGAEQKNVRSLILGEACRLTIRGLVIGLFCSVAAAMLIRKLLFEVSSWDLPTLAAVAIVLAAAAVLASYIPARRAASVNPVDALRIE